MYSLAPLTVVSRFVRSSRSWSVSRKEVGIRVRLHFAVAANDPFWHKARSGIVARSFAAGLTAAYTRIVSSRCGRVQNDRNGRLFGIGFGIRFWTVWEKKIWKYAFLYNFLNLPKNHRWKLERRKRDGSSGSSSSSIEMSARESVVTLSALSLLFWSVLPFEKMHRQLNCQHNAIRTTPQTARVTTTICIVVAWLRFKNFFKN